MRTPLFPNHTAIICVEIVTAVRQDGQNETTATILEENSFGFPYRLATMEVMHYTRSRTVFQPMSTVLTMMEYYEQTVLAGVVMASGGARVFSVDPLTGQECENERCVPPEDLSAAEIAAAAAEAEEEDPMGAFLPSLMPLPPLPPPAAALPSTHWAALCCHNPSHSCDPIGPDCAASPHPPLLFTPAGG